MGVGSCVAVGAWVAVIIGVGVAVDVLIGVYVGVRVQIDEGDAVGDCVIVAVFVTHSNPVFVGVGDNTP